MSTKLQNNWTFWEHTKMPRNASDEDWANSIKEILTFSTMEEFWQIYSFMPRPSEVMFNGKSFPDIENRNIDGFSMFKTGIKPAWEDPLNKNGCELRMIKGVTILDTLDLFWENILISLIGQAIEETNEICGCRITDKSKVGKGPSKSIFNIHIWLKYTDEDMIDKIKLRLNEILASGTRGNFKIPEFEVHAH